MKPNNFFRFYPYISKQQGLITSSPQCFKPSFTQSNTRLMERIPDFEIGSTRTMIRVTPSDLEILSSVKEMQLDKTHKKHTSGFVDSKISSLLAQKGLPLKGQQAPNIIRVRENDTVLTAIKQMHTNKVGAVIVVDSQNKMTGIFSERDYLNSLAVRDLKSKDTYVKDVMTTPVVTVRLDTSTAKCMKIMSQRRFRHLPVIDGDKLVGIVSIGDIVKHIISDQRTEITHLRQVLSGHVDDMDQGL
ncbi:hypothetical protein DFA_00526 [Cavenderia fasciculata]|uniref:CBS domain-containing protein n=1 Tax=Cavenderia fasciculata TaxID=261658 RepID=F4PSB9_CACFS|nr:uncharacterized protein DFA_00526 [Cavenderia fasciculata]EGG20665.1 hypothetical protein DFA_00526 [Cavenderia fasciculata]|eukprot:XP_004358515.1 hypothetical protein DFA_00526 [Cavenderia fasciculata]